MSGAPQPDRESASQTTARRWARLAKLVTRAEFQQGLTPDEHELIRFGRFQAIGPIGEGGYGLVFKAWDPDLERLVAIKLCLARSDRRAQALAREAKTLAKLNHPNIVTVHELGRYGEHWFIAMEYVDGSSLMTFARADPSCEAIIDVYRGFARGLSAAHEAGIVHRDVKPSNMLVRSDGVPRIVDFGLARLQRAPTVDQRRRHVPSGTPAYMAPEVLKGQEPDARSDQFSFCVAMWETFTKEPLFRGARPRQVRRQLKHLSAKLEHERIPAGVREVLRRGLANDPSERFPSMAALLAELDRLHAAGLEHGNVGRTADIVASISDRAPEPPTRPRLRLRVVEFIAVGVVLALLGFVLHPPPRSAGDSRFVEKTLSRQKDVAVLVYARRGEANRALSILATVDRGPDPTRARRLALTSRQVALQFEAESNWEDAATAWILSSLFARDARDTEHARSDVNRGYEAAVMTQQECRPDGPLSRQ